MKLSTRIVFALGLVIMGAAANAGTQFSEKDYTLYAGDFNGDGRSDLLYIGKTPDKPNGIALADSSGAPQLGFQSWPATYLGIPWSTGQYVPSIGDFNGDGKSDIFMQAATAGPSYVLLANTNTALGDVGQIVGINQGINQTDLGTQWSADQHKILVGDFDGDGKADVLLQATAKGGTNAIVLTASNGSLFTRNGSAIGCSASGPQQCWTDGEQGLSWSTKNAVLAVGKFNADSRADILYLPRPNIVMIDFDVTFPVTVFKPNTFGIFLSQMSGAAMKVLGTANQLWSKSDLGAQWSPMNLTAFAADFNGDGYGDVLLQSRGGSNVIAYGNSSGVLGTAVAPASNVAGWNSNSYTAVVGRFGNSTTATLYLQAKDGSGSNYYTSNISAGSVSAYSSSLVLVANVPASATTIGATPASADVSQNGAASYSIPIELPRGTAGLTPELSLAYSSSAGNGLVGVGWNLAGLGMIARCPKTLAQDGVVQGVQLTSNDEYCLNGSRLRRVSGSQGLANSEYRTELETFALVKVLSNTSSGPTTWQVRTKDGLIYEYGGNADARIGVPGNTSVVRVWALSKVSDRALSATTGNYWTVTYTNDAAGSGAYRPDYIDYTTSSVATPSAAPYRVKFYYENRNSGENVVSYYGGGLISQAQRLQRIELQSSAGGALIRKYTLGYQPVSGSFNVLSRLGSVQECSPTACMAATTFSWSDSQLSGGMPAVGAPLHEYGLGYWTYNMDTPGYYGSITSYALDINGDGLMDGVRATKEDIPYTGGSYGWYELFIGTANGQVPAAINFVDNPPANAINGVYDLDADGKDDVAFMSSWLHQKPDGTYALEPTSPTLNPNVMPNISGNLVDIDGDGFLDAVNLQDSTHLRARFHNRNGSTGFETATSVVWTAPSGTTLAPVSVDSYLIYNFGQTQNVKHADVNGDGRQDLVVAVNNGWRVLYSTGSTFTTGELIVSGPASPSSWYSPVIPVDMDGDGCTDFAYIKSGYWYFAKSRCGAPGANLLLDQYTGIAVTSPMPPSQGSYESMEAADVNGDGNMDLVVGPVVLLSTGNGFINYGTFGGYATNNAPTVSDRNGDGVPDLVSQNPGYEPFGYFTSKYTPGLGSRPNFLTSATDGFGKVAKFNYATLSDSSVYTRGATGIGRTQDVQSAMAVVKSMTLSDGVGGNYTQSYTYAGAKSNLAGRGFLGFASREVTDSRTGFVSQETYNNTIATDHTGWELVGTLTGKTIYQYKNGATYGPKVEESTQTWYSITPTGNSAGKYPFVAGSVVKRYELTGTNSPNATSTTALAGTNGLSGIDGYGTIYDTSTTTVEGISGLSPGATATVRRYTPTASIRNDVANWCIGRPERVEDIRSHTYDSTDGAELTRVHTQVWDSAKCRITHASVAPGTNWQLDSEIEYDNFNNVNKTTVTGNGIPASNPIVTQAYFGDNGHLQRSATNAKGHVTYFDWNVNLGFVTSKTDPNNQVVTFIPDDFGREKEMIRPNGIRTFKSYFNCTSANSFCGDGLLRYVVRTEERNAANDPNSLINYSDQFLDLMGRVKYEQSRGFDGQTVVMENLYDSRGNVALKTDPHYAGSSASGVAMTYDSLNRLVRTDRQFSDTDRTLVSENIVYEGLKVRSFDANGAETAKTLNVLAVVSQAVDTAGKITSYTYNSFGDLLKVKDPANNVTTIQYNARGFKSNSTDPDMGYWSFTYDALGRMLSQIDAKNQKTDFEYDELGRLKKRKDHPGTTADETNWTWDGPGGVATLYNKGQLYNVTSPGGYSETMAYDTRARRSQLQTDTAVSSFVVNYGYDLSTGLPSNVTYPSSTGSRLSVTYGYQNGFAKDARDTSTGSLIWQANAQDARGHVTQEQYGNGQVTNLGFDQTNGRLYTVQTGTNSATQNLTYTWDRVGNLTSRRDNNQGIAETFGYDAIYRLTSVQRNGVTTTTMAYDTAGIGNVVSKSDAGAYDYSTPQSGCTYYSNSQPHAVRKVGTSIYCYDANGNMVSRAGATLSYSSFNYPTAINQVGGNSSTFSYGAGRNRYRTISVDAGVTEDKIEIAGGAFEKVVTGTQIQYRHNIQVGGKTVAIVTRNATTSAPTTLVSAKSLYLHEDHLGSTDVITNESNAIVVRTSFDSWGQRRGSNWSGAPSAADKAAIATATRKGYTGHQQLDNLNLVHMNGRVYDPAIARFISADPVIQDPYHSQAFNRYSYVWNNPLNATDPTGNVGQGSDGEATICATSENPKGHCGEVGGKGDPGSKNGQTSGAPPTNLPTANQTGVNGSAQTTAAKTPDTANKGAPGETGPNPADENLAEVVVTARKKKQGQTMSLNRQQIILASQNGIWLTAPVTPTGFADNKELKKVLQSVNAAPAQSSGDIEASQELIDFMRAIGPAIAQAAGGVKGERFVFVDRDASGELVVVAIGVTPAGTQGAKLPKVVALAVGHVHYPGLSQTPDGTKESDHNGVKARSIPVFMWNSTGTKTFEIGRQGGVYKSRNDTNDPLGKWKFYAK
ncbi:MAG: FG-GAP-like repeat-containing protein [Pseudomonadota bacterium]